MEEAMVLGVDSGNTKSDFYLFSASGEKKGHLRCGSCSHEALGSYDAAKAALQQGIGAVCAAAGIQPAAIQAAVLGLAGADIPGQYRQLEAIAGALLPCGPLVCNDSMLGVKAAAPGGVGLCCINGTGATVSGVDDEGRRLQVGGIGPLTSDFAGGGFAAEEVLRRVYDQLFRDGAETLLTPGVQEVLSLSGTEDFMTAIHPDVLPLRRVEHPLGLLLFRCARGGDAVAAEVLARMADTLAATTAGCIKRLRFAGPVTVVLAGSLWVKEHYPPMQARYRQQLERRTGRECHLLVLEQPPVVGAVFWALERLAGSFPPAGLRQKIIAQMAKEAKG